MKLKTGQKEVPSAEKGCCQPQNRMPATHRILHCIQRASFHSHCDFSLALRLCLRSLQRQDKVYGRWFLFLSSFWIKALSKRCRWSIVLVLSLPLQPPYLQMYIDTNGWYSNAQAQYGKHSRVGDNTSPLLHVTEEDLKKITISRWERQIQQNDTKYYWNLTWIKTILSHIEKKPVSPSK